MALHVTQCPRCESTFNTSARTLQAARGLVRCGACLSIFEADQHFINPLPDASNDEPGEHGTGSVFISAPEDYFDPAEFLNQGDQTEERKPSEDDAGSDVEPLYAKSDLQDSSFDVFDVDPELASAKVHEQILDSDFDVFEAGEFQNDEEDLKAEVQDSRFDIFDAGAKSAGTQARDLANASKGTLPQGPDAEALFKNRAQDDGSIVILPAGPDAATLLAERKKAIEQSTEQAGTERSPESGPGHEQATATQSATNEEQAATGQVEQPTTARIPETVSAPEEEAVDDSTADFSEALTDALEWDDSAEDAAFDSVVILPADPYQPSAFTATGEPPRDSAEPAVQEAASDTFTDTDTNIAPHQPPAAPAGPEPDIPTLTNLADTAENHSEEQSRPTVAEDEGKDVIRSRVMATDADKQEDSLEQLSEENLRAVRDFDTALELEHRKQSSPKRTGTIAATGLLLALLATLIFFWVRMPELSQDSRFRSWYQATCDLIGCELPDYVNPGRVETSNLVVRSHPERDNMLELTAVFSNSARFPQPFPLIELTFSDLNNRPMMVFEFLPGEYLPQALRGMPLMPVASPVQITLALADPGPDAVNYQMTFKAAPPRPR